MSKPTRIHELVANNTSLRPDHVAIMDSDGKEISWRQYYAVIQEAAQLLSDQGIKAGDRIFLVAENSLATAAFIFSAGITGAVLVPVNARMGESELKSICVHAMPVLQVYTSACSDAAAKHAVKAKAVPVNTSFGQLHIKRVNKAANQLDDFSTVQANNSARSGSSGCGNTDIELDDDDDTQNLLKETAVILYTTGTTGAPKGVMLSHQNLIFAGRASADLRKMTIDDVVYGVLPLTHVFGLASMLVASASAGACVQLEARFVVERLLAALSSGVTVFPGVPQMHALLMAYAGEQGLNRLDAGQLRYVSSGAAPLDPAWKRDAEKFYGIALQNGYGMTESTAGVSGTRHTRSNSDISVGRPLPGIEVKLQYQNDAKGMRPVGEILTRGPHVMLAYFRNPQASREAVDEQGFLHTGDLGQFDEHGNLHVVGRSKELIIRGGFNVYPPEVEAALNHHPDVIQSAVVGRACGGDEEILAFVQCTAGSEQSAEVLKEFVAGRLTKYKCPTHILCVSELPAAATGKIYKHRLTDVFARELSNI